VGPLKLEKELQEIAALFVFVILPTGREVYPPTGGSPGGPTGNKG